MKAPYLFADVGLREGFCFPEDFMQALTEYGSGGGLYPWYFINFDGEYAKGIYEYVNSGHKRLVPFAKREDDEAALACFDGDDQSGQPKIYFVTSNADGPFEKIESIDWSTRFYVENFRIWIQKVRRGELG